MEAGIYEDLPNAEYHSQTEWVSSTQIKRHLPEQYKPSDSTVAKDFGSALHNTVLGTPEPFDLVDAATWTGKAAKDQQAASWAAGRIALLSKDVPIIHAMAEAVLHHDEARTLLREVSGLNEVSVFAEDYRGMKVKARFDRLIEDSAGNRTGIDLKSFTGKPGKHSIAKAVIDYGYDVQQAHYEETAVAGGIPLDRFVLIFVSKEPPHYVQVAELDANFLRRGRTLREIGIDRMLNPEMVDSYEGASGTLKLSLPRWAQV